MGSYHPTLFLSSISADHRKKRFRYIGFLIVFWTRQLNILSPTENLIPYLSSNFVLTPLNLMTTERNAPNIKGFLLFLDASTKHLIPHRIFYPPIFSKKKENKTPKNTKKKKQKKKTRKKKKKKTHTHTHTQNEKKKHKKEKKHTGVKKKTQKKGGKKKKTQKKKKKKQKKKEKKGRGKKKKTHLKRTCAEKRFRHPELVRFGPFLQTTFLPRGKRKQNKKKLLCRPCFANLVLATLFCQPCFAISALPTLLGELWFSVL